MKIIWSPLAVNRLEEIYNLIAMDDKSAAQKTAHKIFERIETLPDFPQRGRRVPEVNRKEIREIFEGEYRIIYRIESKAIFILTIRNFKELLPQKDL